MSGQFYTPSLGDEVLDLTDCEPNDVHLGVGTGVDAVPQHVVHVQPPMTMAARKQGQSTGYTEFFREKTSIIKKEKPEITFHELSQIVKNLWQSLSAEEKTHYNDATSAVAEDIFGGSGNKQLPTQLTNATASVEPKSDAQSVDETAEQMLNEASGARKCTRENCNKRAIINPDWEDEYCSNECVILHCRSVFSSWVDVTKLHKKNHN